jgi:hypothetical protein
VRLFHPGFGRNSPEKREKTNENGLITGFVRETSNCGYLATFLDKIGNLFRFMASFSVGLEK